MRKHVVWVINRETLSTRSTWARVREKYSITGKKSQNRNISPIWGEAPAERIEMKICTGVDLGDIITDVKFKLGKFQRFWCHGGQNSPFPIDFARGPYHSAALPRCLWKGVFRNYNIFINQAQNNIAISLKLNIGTMSKFVVY